jgi:hypothetical protein
LWVQNAANTWCCPYRLAGYSAPSTGVELILGGMQAGSYLVQWWEDGLLLANETVVAVSGDVLLQRPGLVSDWAIKVELDQDGDALPDRWELDHGLDPSVDDSAYDGDGDGLDNLDEYSHGASPGDADSDGDGVLDGAELTDGTRPDDPDSDGDGMPDGWELAHGLANLDPTDADLDADGDGLSNLQEFERSLDPQAADSDSDGVDDGAEVTAGSDPLLP